MNISDSQNPVYIGGGGNISLYNVNFNFLIKKNREDNSMAEIEMIKFIDDILKENDN